MELAWYRNKITRNQDQPKLATCQQRGLAEETWAHLMTECPILQDTYSHHFNADDPITFLLNEPTVTLSYLRDAGLSEIYHVWSSTTGHQKKTTTMQWIIRWWLISQT